VPPVIRPVPEVEHDRAVIDHEVGAIAAVEAIGPRAAAQEVIGAETPYRVIRRSTGQFVLEVGADDQGHARQPPAQRVGTFCWRRRGGK
jgi:hypothetical protein